MIQTRIETMFRPMRIKGVELRNRIVVPPMFQFRPITSPDGLAWYRRLAAGGASLVMVESTSVSRFAGDLSVDALRPLVSAIHDQSAAAVLQLSAPRFDDGTSPHMLGREDIENMVDLYGHAAAACREAGFDGVEIHGAHGFILNQFFMPDWNHRTDDYGGKLENRCRLGVRIAKRVRDVLGRDPLLLYRHTPKHGDYGIDDSLVFAGCLIFAGVDVLDISPAREARAADLAEPFKSRFGVPVIAVGGMDDPAAASEALERGRCDLVAVGRQLVADAEWPRKVQERRFDQIIHCEKCDLGCYGNLKLPKPIECVNWRGDVLKPYR